MFSKIRTKFSQLVKKENIAWLFLEIHKKNTEKPYISSYLLFIGLFFTSLYIVGWKILICLFILFMGVVLKFSGFCEKIFSKGLMNYLPRATQKILINRSFFDILCDFWYIGRIPSYFKVFLQPLFLEIEPEQAITNLNELHPSIRQIILRKGIINNFPEGIKKLILPNHVQQPKYNILQELDDTYVEDKSSSNSNELQLQKLSSQFQLQQSEAHQIEFTPGKELLSNVEQKKQKFINDTESEIEFPQFSIQRGGSCGNIFQMLGKKYQRQTNSEQQSELADNDEQLQLNASLILGNLPMKTKVITSSGSITNNSQLLQKFFNNKLLRMTGNNEQNQFSEKWDKLELFQKEKKQFKGRSIPESKFKIKGPIALIYSLLRIKKIGLANAIGSKDLRLIFALSSLGFLWQLYISKRVRGWTANVFVIMFYIIFFVLSTSSWFLIVYKMIKSRSITQNQIGMNKEENEIEEEDEEEDEDNAQEEINKLNNEDIDEKLN